MATENGPKAIEAIAVGDRVLSSTEEGEVSYRPVTRVFERHGAEEVALTFTDAHGVGAPIVTTPEHPFRVASGEWVVAGRLDIGDNVVTAEGGLATLSAALSLEKSSTVYNFEVEGTHSYFVGAAKLWVHNACDKQGSGRGRGANNLKPDPSGSGPHSTYKTDASGQVTNHSEWSPNPRNPSGYDQAKRVDVTGKGHYNSASGSEVPTPHTHDPSAPGGVRPASSDEVPEWWKRRH